MNRPISLLHEKSRGRTETITRPAPKPSSLYFSIVYSKVLRLASLFVAGPACIEWFGKPLP